MTAARNPMDVPEIPRLDFRRISVSHRKPEEHHRALMDLALATMGFTPGGQVMRAVVMLSDLAASPVVRFESANQLKDPLNGGVQDRGLVVRLVLDLGVEHRHDLLGGVSPAPVGQGRRERLHPQSPCSARAVTRYVVAPLLAWVRQLQRKALARPAPSPDGGPGVAGGAR